MAEPTLAEKIARAAWVMRPQDRSTAWTKAEICSGTGISASYLDNLLSGRQANPTVDVVVRLATFFGIPDPGFFLPKGADGITERLARLERVELAADETVTSLASQLTGLPPSDRAVVTAALTALLALDGTERDLAMRMLRGVLSTLPAGDAGI